jgi:hypothetical protein
MTDFGFWAPQEDDPGEQLITETRQKASETVAFTLSHDFDAGRMDSHSRGVYEAWVAHDPSNAFYAAQLFGSARMSIKAARLAGLSEEDIRHQFIGEAHDLSVEIRFRSGDATSEPGNDRVVIQKAIFEQAVRFTSDQDWEVIVREIEQTLERQDGFSES